ncbi:MAG: ADP-ribosylglycohydrolase family protein [Deltaproteobacteria bacterium]|nr:ADP-ribosylglycohydrolase family protein [Deltaproteobacteria bacterium]
MRIKSSPTSPSALGPTAGPSARTPVKVALGQTIDLAAMTQALGAVKGPEAKNASSVMAKNQALMPEVSEKYAASDPEARAFAKSALEATLAARAESAARQGKGDDRVPRTPEQRFMQLAGGWIRAHHAIVEGYDKSLENKSPEVVAERQRLSRAVLAEVSERLWSQVPLETAFRRIPRETAALLSPKTEAAAQAIDQRVQLSEQQAEVDRVIRIVDDALAEGFEASTIEKQLVGKAKERVEVSPQEAFDGIVDLAQRAHAFLKAPRSPKLKRAELDTIKKQAKQPLLSQEEKFQKGLERVAQLEAEISGAKTPTLVERYKGAMIGLAIGDALGGPTEFMSREDLRKAHGLVVDMIGGGWLKLAPGEYTDDTQMAEAMAKSIVEKGGLDPNDLASRYVAWLDTDPKDVGGLTRQALELARVGVAPEDAGRIPWVLSGFENAGNGSVMRAAPVALLTAFDAADEIEAKATASSAPTHADPRCLYGTAAISMAVSLIMKGEPDVLSKVVKYLSDKSPETAKAIAAVPTMALEDLRTSGYVVDTVQAAFWALHHAQSYVDGIVAVTNLGEDTDTAGATAGILLGAKFGLDGIPSSWRKTLQNADGLEALADGLFALSKAPKDV